MTELQIEQINRALKRIFALPISRMTVKEVQNAIRSIFPNEQEKMQAIYNSLLSGEIGNNLDANGNKKAVEQLIDSFSSSVRLAREVAEMGEFMNSFSCDFFQQGKQVFFVNRMRRLDGQEYYFLSAPDTNIRLAHMFISRLEDLKNATKGQVELHANIKKELNEIKNVIDTILA